MTSQPTSPLAAKPHYLLLDGLRGVAAFLVLWYHVFEGYAFAGQAPAVPNLTHGYLAVDFFFLLSGFVMGYAYDDRWHGRLTVKRFFLRRLIRLHPMVVMGAVVGVAAFVLGGCLRWDGTQTAISSVMLALLLQMFLLPALPGTAADVRGNGEMFSRNGPSWSLFFEYVGNILYALFLRRLSTRWLAVLTGILGIALTLFAALDVSGYGMLGVGWSLADWNLPGGVLRMLFPYALGLLLSRKFRPVKVRGAFWICSALLLTLFLAPPFANQGGLCLNALYDVACIILIFPLILWLAASGHTSDRLSTGLCRFLGDISYPLYIVHYPLMYLFYAWMIETGNTGWDTAWPQSFAVVGNSLLLAFILLKIYDLPIRKWLGERFLETGH